jgi:hypothetical protein
MMIQKLALLFFTLSATSASANLMPKCNVAADNVVKAKFGDLLIGSTEVRSNDCMKGWSRRGPTEMVCHLTTASTDNAEKKFLVIFSDESCEVVFTTLLLER